MYNGAFGAESRERSNHPMVIAFFFLIIIAAVALIVVGAIRASGRPRVQSPHAAFVTPGGSPVDGTIQMASGQQAADQFAYRQGVAHRSNATLFGVIGLFILGIVFGPLAIAQANKAEALGVKATAGKVLGAIALVFTVLWVLFVLFGGLIRG